jgi:hypothetical protein
MKRPEDVRAGQWQLQLKHPTSALVWMQLGAGLRGDHDYLSQPQPITKIYFVQQRETKKEMKRI